MGSHTWKLLGATHSKVDTKYKEKSSRSCQECRDAVRATCTAPTTGFCAGRKISPSPPSAPHVLKPILPRSILPRTNLNRTSFRTPPRTRSSPPAPPPRHRPPPCPPASPRRSQSRREL